MDTSRKIARLMRAGQSGIILTTVEPDQVINELRTFVRASLTPGRTTPQLDLFTWGVADGLLDVTNTPNSIAETSAQDLFGAKKQESLDYWKRCSLPALFDWILKKIHDETAIICKEKPSTDDEKPECTTFLIRNADHFIGGPGGDITILAQAQQIVSKGTAVGISLILQTPPGYIAPVELAEFCETVEHDLPTDEERRTVLLEAEVPDRHITPEVIRATAGLSGIKTTQFAAESLSFERRINPSFVFRKKAEFLGRNAKLDIWSPQFQTEIKLLPIADETDLHNVTEVMMVDEHTNATHDDVPEGSVRAKIRFLSRADGVKHSRVLPAMPIEEFERQYRPQRNEYSFDAVVGLDGVKRLLTEALRPGIPDRAKLRHVLLLGVPGVGKSMLHKCVSGQFNMPLTSMQSANLYSKWLGDTDKALYWMLKTVTQIGGIFGIDEFQRFLPNGNNSENGTENRVLGTLLTWLNDQRSNLVLSAANNVSHLPDEVTRSGRVDALVFVGFPGAEAKKAAWDLYIDRHELNPDQVLPDSQFWTPADIQACCRHSEMQNVPLLEASQWIIPSYKKNQTQMDSLLLWAENAGCICAETGKPFKKDQSLEFGAATVKGADVKKPIATAKARRITRGEPELN